VDLDLGTYGEAHRQTVRRFLAEHAPDGVFASDWPRRLAVAGYAAPHWPEPFGRAASPLEQLVIDQELRAAKAPRPFNPIGIGWAGPTILVGGTPEQQQRFLPGILDGSELWCQLFSEPEAGSDLASLTTRAALDGDEWVVQGTKCWTTFAHEARWGILLARTDPAAAPQRGITYFVLDMRTPGITVRPIKQMNGARDFNEVFLDEVRVPAANVIGAVHDGWRLAKVTLGNERVSLSGEGALWGQGPTAGDLLDLVRDRGGADDPMTRQRLAAVHIESEVLRMLRLRLVAAAVQGQEPGPEASVRKAIADEHGQHVMAMAVELAGTGGLLMNQGPGGRPTSMWSESFLYAAALTIGGGTSEVQRTIIGERVLGLPKEPQR